MYGVFRPIALPCLMLIGLAAVSPQAQGQLGDIVKKAKSHVPGNAPASTPTASGGTDPASPSPSSSNGASRGSAPA